ncbi:MAG: FIST C-terminal domain-containing protein [Campylobacteraceae bacterium]|nr:FIST C-terminal domain-containing protein [Campylobacteraceae bacterium]
MNVTVAFLETSEELEKYNFSNSSKYLILCTQNSKIDLNILNSFEVEYYGAIFPKLIFKNKIIEDGYLICKLNGDVHIEFIEDMGKYQFTSSPLGNYNTLITIIDGLSDYNTSFLENMFEHTQINSTIIGGGAGNLKKDKKYLFNSEGFYENSSIIVMIDNNIDIGISEGWQVLDGPFVVTSSEGKLLKELDYKSAFELYKTAIEKDLGTKVEVENFYTLMKDYPLGILKNDEKYILRDPISFQKEALHLAGDIENNSVINILKAKESDLLESTANTRSKVLQSGAKHLMIFECVSRLEYLTVNSYSKQLRELNKCETIKSVFGVVSIGEIANSGEKYIDLLNKSCVIGGICH